MSRGKLSYAVRIRRKRAEERRIRRHEKMVLRETRLTEDSPDSAAVIEKLGFMPDVLVRVVGVASGTEAPFRQRALEKGAALGTPPVRLIPEPKNPYDPLAVKVFLGIEHTKSADGGIRWTYAHVGYLPRAPQRFNSDSKAAFTIPVRLPGGSNMPVATLLSKIEKGEIVGKVLQGMSWIAKAPGTSYYGMEIGLKHHVEASEVPSGQAPHTDEELKAH